MDEIKANECKILLLFPQTVSQIIQIKSKHLFFIRKYFWLQYCIAFYYHASFWSIKLKLDKTIWTFLLSSSIWAYLPYYHISEWYSNSFYFTLNYPFNKNCTSYALYRHGYWPNDPNNPIFQHLSEYFDGN